MTLPIRKPKLKWKEYKHVAWSAGYCRHCQNLEAIRVQDIIEDAAIYLFIPVSRRLVGRNGICDLCERPLEKPIAKQLVAQGAWLPTDGMPKLLGLLSIKGKVTLPRASPDARLLSLLSSTATASKLQNVNILPGLIAGVFGGALLGVLLGMLMFGMGIRLGAPDRLGTSMVMFLVGGVTGSAVGAALYGLWIRTRTASRKILLACRKYSLDRARLAELSHDYNRHVQRAARAVVESATESSL
jgi:hypothetical protein